MDCTDEIVLRCLTSTRGISRSRERNLLPTRQLAILIDVAGSSRQSSTFFKDFFNTLVSALWSHRRQYLTQPRVSSSSYRRLPEKFSFLVSTCHWNARISKTTRRRWSYSCQFLQPSSISYFAEIETALQNSLYAERFHPSRHVSRFLLAQ